MASFSLKPLSLGLLFAVAVAVASTWVAGEAEAAILAVQGVTPA